jgi:hypothetical protein
MNQALGLLLKPLTTVINSDPLKAEVFALAVPFTLD